MNIIKSLRKILYIPAILLILAAPYLSYIVFESITGVLPLIEPLFAKMNLLFYYALYLALFALIGSTRFSVPLAGLLCWLLGCAEFFTESYSGHPITPQSIFQLKTLGAVIGGYHFTLTPEMLQPLKLLIPVWIVAILFPLRVRGLIPRLVNLGVCGAASILLAGSFYLYFTPKHEFLINQWDASIDYEEKGFAYAFALSLNAMKVQPPEHYSAAYASELAHRIAQEAAPHSANGVQQPVNLIVIMNETLSELKVAGDFTTNEPYFPYLDALTEAGRISRGNLYVPVFGSGTSNTEFEVLTGDSISRLPFNANAFSYFVPDGMGSLVSTVKEQGYRAVAMHPMPAADWNRDEAYAALGFDSFLDYDNHYFGHTTLLRNFVSDVSDYDCLLEQIRAKNDPSEKLFLFNVTIQNHGGYGEKEKLEGMPDIHLTGDYEGLYPYTDQFLSLIKASDDAFEHLFTQLETLDEPTMVVIFGDHQPSVENEFYDAIAGEAASEASQEERLKWYQTPVFFWANYDAPGLSGEALGDVSAVALGSMVLERAGLAMTPYQDYLLRLRSDFPIMQPIGIRDADGAFYSWTQAADPQLCGKAQEIIDYEYLLYAHVHGEYNELFHLK